MATEPKGVSEREQLLDEVLTSYLEAADAGQSPDPKEWLARYPEFAAELAEFFADQEQFRRLTRPLQIPEPSTSSPRAALETPPVSGNVADSPPQIAGPTFGDYELLQEIGHGGMGVVYKARQKSLNRLVALKMIRSKAWADPAEIQRFRNETEAAAHLDHPHTVPIYEVGQHDRQHYFTMKLIEGGSLAQRMTDLQLPLGDRKTGGHANRRGCSAAQIARCKATIVRLLATVARAVHYAHQRGILHRDLKPANILLDEQGQPFVTDFGLAKWVTTPAEQLSQGGVSLSGAIVGTPSYMAPEQAAGQVRLTTAADIYSLGTILYELLTGRPPFRTALPLETLRQVIEEEPSRPRQVNPCVDRDLETICLKCLEKDPERRYRSPEALAEDLERWLAGKPIQARLVSNTERLWRWCRRNPAVAALAASVAVLVVVVAVVSSLAAVRLQERLLDSKFEQAKAKRTSGQVGQRFQSLELLAEVSKSRPSLEVRNEALACLVLADLKDAKEWELDPSCKNWPVFDTPLERYAAGDEKGNISVRRVADNEELVRLPGDGVRLVFQRFSPNGQYLAAKYHDATAIRLSVWDLTRREAVLKNDRLGWSDGVGDFSPDSRWLAMSHQDDSSVRLYDLHSGKEEKRLPAPKSPYKSICFSPDGRRLAIAAWQFRGLQIYDLATGKLIRTLGQPAGVHCMAWRDDGKVLATACEDRQIYVWDLSQDNAASPGLANLGPSNNLAGWLQSSLGRIPWEMAKPRELLTVLKGHQGAVIWVGFNHRGDLLVSQSWDGTTRVWNPVTSRQLLQTSRVGCSPQFSPDDQFLGWGWDGSRICLREVASGQECRTLPCHKGLWTIDMTSDGRLLAAPCDEGVQLYDLVAGREIAFLPIGKSDSVLFDPRGTSLFTSGSAGLHRWPIQRDADPHATGITIGAREALGIPNSQGACLSPDGRTMAVVSHAQQVLVFDLSNPSTKFPLIGQPGLSGLSFSPDGKWLVAGNWHQSEVRIWDARTREHVKDLSLGASTWGRFSPDSKWLVTSTGQEYRFWEAGSWQPGSLRLRRQNFDDMPGGMAFAPDGKMLAIADSRTVARLVDARTGQELATLPPTGAPMGFSPDGSVLVTSADDGAIQLWNLRLLREQLAKMNLDWEPPFQPSTVNSNAPQGANR